jgi:hypothetical protein
MDCRQLAVQSPVQQSILIDDYGMRVTDGTVVEIYIGGSRVGRE